MKKYLLPPLLIVALIISYITYSNYFKPAKLSVNEVTTTPIIDPQYIFVRKNNTFNGPFLWNGYWPDRYNDAAIAEIVNTIGTKGTSTRRLGVGAIFTPNGVDLERTKQSLSKLLQISLSNDFPVYLSIDNFSWWEGRSDLWNWWDPSKPGYNSNNRNNVEWIDWDGETNDEHVIKISWTNWGGQFRRPPGPNLLSPAYINSSINNIDQLLPIVTSWYNSLPADKKYLLGGIDFGNELDIGGNYYYYANGNAYLNQPATSDPAPSDFLTATVQTGFAALKSGNIKSSGTVTTQDLNQAVNRYLSILNKHAYEMGIPRNKIFNHTGGKGSSPDWVYPSSIAFTDLGSSVMPYAHPGWSFYGDITTNPQNNTLLANALNAIGKTQWAVPEWLTYATDYNGWLTSLRNTLNYRNNRLINAANWEDIKSKPYAIEAIRQALNESPTCWVTTPQMDIVVTGNSALINWRKGASNEAIFINVSNSEEFTPAGTLKTVNIANANVTTQTNHTLNNLPTGKYYVILVADGCGDQRRIVYGSFTIGVASTPTPTPTPTTLPGDLNSDGHVNLFDYNLLVAGFGTTYSIFDYNLLVSNYGK